MPKDKPTAKMGRKPRPAPPAPLLKQVRDKFDESGVTIRGWAKAQGFTYCTVIDVLHGRRTGQYGEAHRVAVALGIKQGRVADAATFDPRKVPAAEPA